jgi:prepilin-type N-terminal cleavage/methylation domain-containing protein
MRRGFTLPELLSVMVMLGVLASIVTPPVGRVLDQAAVREGVDRFAALYATTRQLAMSRGALARLELDRGRRAGTLSVQRDAHAWDTVATSTLGAADLTCSTCTLVFNPIGVGYGTSNSRVVFSRGGAADTVTTSRTGRLKR